MKSRRVSFQPAPGVALCAMLVSAIAAHAQDAATKPTVGSAIINSSANPATITITGADLLPATGSPVVKLDGAILTLVSSSSTQIVADLPAGLAAGSRAPACRGAAPCAHCPLPPFMCTGRGL